jgi:hypothetical protein
MKSSPNFHADSRSYLELKHRIKSEVNRQLGKNLAMRRTKELGKQIAEGVRGGQERAAE